ncbi:MAG: hypothetical protein ABSC15_11195 [Terriglobales bacterium]|jgi:hypothetical protein
MFNSHRESNSLKVFSLLLIVCSIQSAAQTFRGIVHNGTGGKPQPGALVLLMTGKREIGRAISGNNGEFRIVLENPPGAAPDAFKVQLVHDGVTYQQPIKSGFAADVTVYDQTAGVEGLIEYLGILQFEARTVDRLLVTELHAIQNNSWPPRTTVNRDSFNLSLPKGAHNLLVTISEPDGQGAKLSITDPANPSAPHRLAVPLKPGVTKYVLTYDLAYRGDLRFRQAARYLTKETLIILPASMHFISPATLHFHPVPDPTGAQVEEIDSLAKNAVMTFTISGTGVLAQAFRQIGGSYGTGSYETDGEAMLTQTDKLAAASDASNSAASASNPSNQKAPQPAPHSPPASQSVRNWAALALVFCLVGILLAWKLSRTKLSRTKLSRTKLSRTKVRHGSA